MLNKELLLTPPLTNSIQLPFIQGEYTSVIASVSLDVDPLFPAFFYFVSGGSSVAVDPGQHRIVCSMIYVPDQQTIVDLNTIDGVSIPPDSYIFGVVTSLVQAPFEYSVDITVSGISSYQYGYYEIYDPSVHQYLYVLGMTKRLAGTRAPDPSGAFVDIKFTAL